MAASVPGVDDSDLLQPVNFYAREGRQDEYREMVERLRLERTEYLLGFAAMSDRVLAGLNG